MVSLSTLLWVYLFGGITFIPLVIAAIFFAGFYTFPIRDDLDDPRKNDPRDGLIQPGDDVTALEAALEAALEGDKKDKASRNDKGKDHEKEKDKGRHPHDGDVAAGYFAVCREYTPMGINAKPIERNPGPGSNNVAAPSQSIYQAMYRGIFERKQTTGPIDNSNPMNHRPKKAGNVYYVLLRHGHLMLFDDEDQTEVRYVISLLLHGISIYSGGDETPEGELFIKRNAIRLARKADSKEVAPDGQLPKPFYLFSENCSSKEDFYFALLRNQDQVLGSDIKAPRPQQFDTKHIISLVQRLYATEDNMDTRWLNAILGRVFLGIYQTRDIEQFVREKITMKISRIKRPSFLTHITVRRIDLGHSAPFITNPRLKDLTVQGECVTEADLRYTGNFRIEIGTTAKMDLGSFQKEVTLVLAVVIKKLEGHALMKIKGPPSNRVWLSFIQMPKLEMSIEPIVSSRQITWTLVLNQIESRIREVVAETMVLPFWDDTPFFKTEHKKWRGGIWEDDDAVRPPPDLEAAAAQGGNVDEVEKFEQAGSGHSSVLHTPSKNKDHLSQHSDSADPSPTPSPGLFGRKLTGKGFLSSTKPSTPTTNATSTGIETKPPTHRASRPVSISSAPIPIVGTDKTNSDVFKPATPPDAADVASRMATLSARVNQEHTATSPVSSPHGSPGHSSSLKKPGSIRSVSSREADPEDTPTGPTRTDTTLTSATGASLSATNSISSTEGTSVPISPMSSKPSLRTVNTGSSITRGLFTRKDDSQASLSSTGTGDSKRATALAAMSSAATQARQWGLSLSALKRQEGKAPEAHVPPLDLSQPMGRGQPLPPPGVPLPGPDRKTPTAPIPPSRKIVPPPHLPPQRQQHIEGGTGPYSHSAHPVPPPFLGDSTMEEHRRRSNGSSVGSQGDVHGHGHSHSLDHHPEAHRRPVPVPPLPERRRASHIPDEEHPVPEGETLLVVKVPDVSEPTSPSPDHPMFQKPWAAADDTSPTSGGVHSRAGLGIQIHPPPPPPPPPLPTRSATTAGTIKKKRKSPPPNLPPRRADTGGLDTVRGLDLSPRDEDTQDDLSGWMGDAEFDGIDIPVPPPPTSSSAAPSGGAGAVVPQVRGKGTAPSPTTATTPTAPTGTEVEDGGAGAAAQAAALQAARKAVRKALYNGA